MSDGLLACSRCGARQPDGERCARCGTDSLQDLRSRLVRDMFSDAEARYRRARIEKITRYGAAISAVVSLTVWLIPGYWTLFRGFRPRAMAATQVALVFGVAFGAIAVLDRIWPRRRFPFLDALPPPDRQ
jgi:hypothetical protein